MGNVLAVTWVARPGEEEAVADVLRKMVPATRAEPGCIHYYVNRSRRRHPPRTRPPRHRLRCVGGYRRDDPRRFFLFEEYADDAAQQAHVDSEHFQRHVIGEAVPRLETRERLSYRPL